MPAPPPPELPTYRELAPSPALAPWVECFWSIRASDAAGVVNRVVPDGCADLIMGVGGGLDPIVVGTMRTAMLSRLTGPVDLFGVRFHPGAALALIDVPLGELTDRSVELEALWGTDAAALGEAFGPPDLTERAARAEQVLHRRLARWARRRRGDEAMVTEAVALLRRARGGAGVRDVAAALGVGERRLERAFDRSVGVSPKMLDRVMRFRRAIQLLAGSRWMPPSEGWAALALRAGYADQPHFIREFKALSGLTPARYVAERQGVGSVQYGGDAGR